MEENEQQCQGWLDVEHYNFVFWSASKEKWSLFSGNNHRLIEYCPFCGSPLDDQGCTRNKHGLKNLEDNIDDDEIEVPF